MVTFDEQKLRETVLHIAERCRYDASYGVVKLYKTLFYADFEFYREYGKAITGMSYIAWKMGPVPEQRGVFEHKMVSDGELALDRSGGAKRYVPLRPANLDVLTGAEIVAIEDAILRLKGDTADRASDRSHRDSLGWQAAYAEHEATDKQVVIPYGTVFVDNSDLDEFEEARGLQLAKAHGWEI